MAILRDESDERLTRFAHFLIKEHQICESPLFCIFDDLFDLMVVALIILNTRNHRLYFLHEVKEFLKSAKKDQSSYSI